MSIRAIGLTTDGGPEVLPAVQRPEPGAGLGEVRVRVRAARVKQVAAMLRTGLLAGLYQRVGPPYVPGTEVAGVLDELGETVDPALGLRLGLPVVGFVDFTPPAAATATPSCCRAPRSPEPCGGTAPPAPRPEVKPSPPRSDRSSRSEWTPSWTPPPWVIRFWVPSATASRSVRCGAGTANPSGALRGTGSMSGAGHHRSHRDRRAADMVEVGAGHPRRRGPADCAGEAHRLLANGGLCGRIVLHMTA